MRIDEPNVSANKSERENIKELVTYLSRLSEDLNYLISSVEDLRNQVSKIEREEK